MIEYKIKDIVFRKDLYPRFEPNQQLIKKYSESLEYLPPIKIDQHSILIDGFHRLKAHELAELEVIDVEIIEVESEKQLKQLAYQYNSHHGFQLKNGEKKSYAIEMIDDLGSEELAEVLSVSISTINNWTKEKRKSLKEKRDKQIISEYLRGWNTQESIAEMFGLTQVGIKKIITNNKNIKSYNFSPLIYNIWNTPKGNILDGLE